MNCPKCGASFEAVNQHSACPECNQVVGTEKTRDLSEELARDVAAFEAWDLGTRDGRKESELARDYYDGIQWSDPEKELLNKRNQPIITKNRIAKKINFLTGAEIENRTDPKALPRTVAHDDDVMAATDALRYVCDAQNFDQIASAVKETQLIEGAGAALVEHEKVWTPDGETIEVKISHVAWDRLWWDVHSRKPDASDAVHLGTTVWMDLDDAQAEYGERNDTVDNVDELVRNTAERSANTGESYDDKPSTIWASNDGKRQRVRITVIYRRGRDPETGRRAWFTAHFTKVGYLVTPRLTGYLDEYGNHVCPLVFCGAYLTREGVRYGQVKHMIGPQDEINKRSSKALHQLSVDQTIAEEGAIIDPQTARIERAKPDGWVTVQRDALKEGRVVFEKGIERASGQLQLLQEAKQEIDSIGPEMPQIGAIGNAASGVALARRMQIGSLELQKLSDYHKAWRKEVYRQIWLRIRQFWKWEKWLRVRDDAEHTGFRFVGVNRQVPRGQRLAELMQHGMPPMEAAKAVLGLQGQPVLGQVMQAVQAQMQQLGPQAAQVPPQAQEQLALKMLLSHPTMAEPMKIGDVAQLTVDIVLDASPDVAVLQDEEFQQLAQLVPSFLQAKMPAAPLLELMLEASQVRNKRKLLEMVRKAPDPQQVQMQQMMQQLGAAQAKATVDKTQAEAQLSQARAANEAADAQTALPRLQIEMQSKQARAMHDVATAGEIAGGMDSLMPGRMP